MRLSKYVEIWDAILYSIYNFLSWVIYAIRYPQIKKIIKKNQELKNKHKGERCFVVLNGPSLNRYDLTWITNEYVFCVNEFYKSDKITVVNPNYYCWLDNNIYDDGVAGDVLNEVKRSCPNARLILNYKGYPFFGDDERIYYSYNKHLPNKFKIRNNLCSNYSGFTNVSWYTICAAMYMGFSEIYVLGLDFEATGFKHFDKNYPNEDLRANNEKTFVYAYYFAYAKAQLESYYVSIFARKKGVKILNCNQESYIRAFDFADYDALIEKR